MKLVFKWYQLPQLFFVIQICLFLGGCLAEFKEVAQNDPVEEGGQQADRESRNAISNESKQTADTKVRNNLHRLTDCAYLGPKANQDVSRPLSQHEKQQLIDYIKCIAPVGEYLGLTESGRTCSVKIGPSPLKPQDFLLSLEVTRDPPKIGGSVRNLLNSSTTYSLTMLEETDQRVSIQIRKEDRFLGSTAFDILFKIDERGYLKSLFLYDQSGLNQQLSRAECFLTDYSGEFEDPVSL